MVLFYLHEVPRIVKFIETESKLVVSRDLEKGGMGDNLMGTEFQFCNIKKLLQKDGGGGTM